MRTQEQDAIGARVLSGFILTAPASGPGWTITNTGTGAYIVRFTPPFRALLSFTALMENAGGIIIITSRAPDSVTVNTYTTALAATNAAFEFIARGLAR
jgi:hypothetical protein